MDLNKVSGSASRCPNCNTPLIVVPDGDLWCAKCQQFASRPSQNAGTGFGQVRQAAKARIDQLQTEGKPAMALEFDGSDPEQLFAALATSLDFGMQLAVKKGMAVGIELFPLEAGKVAVVLSGEVSGAAPKEQPGEPPADQDPPAGPAATGD